MRKLAENPGIYGKSCGKRKNPRGEILTEKPRGRIGTNEFNKIGLQLFLEKTIEVNKST